MKRDSVQTVTLPILVKTNNLKEADDRGTFFPANWEGSMYIHVVTEADVKKWLRTELSPKDADLFIGASHLKAGYDEADEYTLMRGYEKLRPLVKDLAPPDEFTIDLPTKNGSKITISSGGGQKWRATHWNYSGLLTEMLRQSRFVMWYSEEKYGRFLPALYCLDRRTAVFAMRLAGPIRVCPKCETPFIPIAGNVDYCCIEHREAYRVARFRWRAKQRAEEAKKPVKKQRKARTR